MLVEHDDPSGKDTERPYFQVWMGMHCLPKSAVSTEAGIASWSHAAQIFQGLNGNDPDLIPHAGTPSGDEQPCNNAEKSLIISKLVNANKNVVVEIPRSGFRYYYYTDEDTVCMNPHKKSLQEHLAELFSKASRQGYTIRTIMIYPNRTSLVAYKAENETLENYNRRIRISQLTEGTSAGNTGGSQGANNYLFEFSFESGRLSGSAITPSSDGKSGTEAFKRGIYAKDEVTDIRKWLDENNHQSVTIMYNARNVADFGHCGHRYVDDIMLESSPKHWAENTGNRLTLLKKIRTTYPAKRICFQLVFSGFDDPFGINGRDNAYIELRKFMRKMRYEYAGEGKEDKFFQSDKIIILLVTYNALPNGAFTFHPEFVENTDGTLDPTKYNNSITGVALSLYEQRDMIAYGEFTDEKAADNTRTILNE